MKTKYGFTACQMKSLLFARGQLEIQIEGAGRFRLYTVGALDVILKALKRPESKPKVPSMSGWDPSMSGWESAAVNYNGNIPNIHHALQAYAEIMGITYEQANKKFGNQLQWCAKHGE